MSNLQIEYRAPEALKPRPGNPRTHSRKQIRQIAASIKRFGFVNPVLVDDDGFLIAGNLNRRYIAEITDGLVPALQKRGLVRTGFSNAQFRENLLEF